MYGKEYLRVENCCCSMTVRSIEERTRSKRGILKIYAGRKSQIEEKLEQSESDCKNKVSTEKLLSGGENPKNRLLLKFQVL